MPPQMCSCCCVSTVQATTSARYRRYSMPFQRTYAAEPRYSSGWFIQQRRRVLSISARVFRLERSFRKWRNCALQLSTRAGSSRTQPTVVQFTVRWIIRISTRSDLMGMCSYVPISIQKTTQIGNLSDWHSFLKTPRYKWYALNPFDDFKCQKCQLLPVCMGGCRLVRFSGSRECIQETEDVPTFVRLIHRISVLEIERHESNNTPTACMHLHRLVRLLSLSDRIAARF